MDTPLVSIITNTFNRADLIHRCIESIQRQTYRNYEHIIVDGNSSDNTEEVVKGYDDNHIKYLKLDKNGCGYQLRAGADIAKGKYITFLDDDDEYLPEKLEKQVALFETLSPDYGVVYCWMSYYCIDDPNTCIRIHKTELKGDVADLAPTRPLVCGTPTMMIRRDVFDKYGVSYNDNIGYIGSDWELMARICQHCLVDYVPESLIKVYVNHGHSRLTTDFYNEKARKGILFHTHFLNCFADVFKRNPQTADFHYLCLCRCYITLKDRRNAYKYFKLYMHAKPTIHDVFSLVKSYCKSLL